MTVLLLLIALSLTHASSDSDTPAVPEVPSRIKKCTGLNLPPNADIRIGTLRKKSCSPFNKSLPAQYARLKFTTTLFSTCEVIYDTEVDLDYPPVVEIGSSALPIGVMRSLLKMCVGEVRRLTIPAAFAFGVTEVQFVNDFLVAPGSTVIYDVELLELTDEPPSDFHKNKVKLLDSGGISVKDDPEGQSKANFQKMVKFRYNEIFIDGYREHQGNKEVWAQLLEEWTFQRKKVNKSLKADGEDELVTTIDEVLEEVVKLGEEHRNNRIKERDAIRRKKGMPVESQSNIEQPDKNGEL